MAGFIKLPRDFPEWEWWGKDKHMKLFLWLLCKAKVADCRIGGTVVRRGDVMTTWAEMQQAIDCTRGALSRILRDFSECNEIVTRTDCQKTIVTICKYENYNGYSDSLWTTNGLRTDYERTTPPINKEEIKNDRNNSQPAREGFDLDGSFVTEHDMRSWMQRYGEIARSFGLSDDKLPTQLNEKRRRLIRERVAEKGRGAVDKLFSRLANSPGFFYEGSRGFKGDFTELWYADVFTRVLEGYFEPGKPQKKEKKEQKQAEAGGNIGAYEIKTDEKNPAKAAEAYKEYISENQGGTLARLARAASPAQKTTKLKHINP